MIHCRPSGLLLKEEFTVTIGILEPSIKFIRFAAREIEEATKLHEILYMILVAGNFLNSGGYAGNAAGFRMMSLLKVADMRANRPGMNLIHYVAMVSQSSMICTWWFQETSFLLIMRRERVHMKSNESIRKPPTGDDEHPRRDLGRTLKKLFMSHKLYLILNSFN